MTLPNVYFMLHTITQLFQVSFPMALLWGTLYHIQTIMPHSKLFLLLSTVGKPLNCTSQPTSGKEWDKQHSWPIIWCPSDQISIHKRLTAVLRHRLYQHLKWVITEKVRVDTKLCSSLCCHTANWAAPDTAGVSARYTCGHIYCILRWQNWQYICSPFTYCSVSVVRQRTEYDILTYSWLSKTTC